MAGIFGILGLGDTERVFVSTLGQRVVYDAVNSYLQTVSSEVLASMGVFVEEVTTDHKLRYKLPGGGRLQRMSGQSQAAAVKSYGGWDVAFPLEDFGAQVAIDRISAAYMTVQDLQRHMDTIQLQMLATMRHEVLKSMFATVAGTFVDPNWGSLTVERLANADSVVYPPVWGSETEATENHYLESGYTAASISDTNDPYVVIIDDLEHHFGYSTGGSNIAVFINNAERPETEALTEFTPISDRFIQAGAQTALPTGLPAGMPGRVIGRHNHGCWVVQWDWMPASYAIGIHLDAPAPVMQRAHPTYTNLPSGIVLVAESDTYPFTQSHYEWHAGFGIGNRLNGVVMEFGTGGTYTVPTVYQ